MTREVALRIVVLMKAVPVVGNEKLVNGDRVDRGDELEINGNDEYLLEAALKLVESHRGEVTLLTMGPAGATAALRRGLAMGASRAVLVQDGALVGSDARATGMVLTAALHRLEYDLVFAGADTSDGQGGVIAAWVAARVGLPYLSYASHIETAHGGARVRIHRLRAAGYDILEAPTPALVMGTQLLGEPRYPSLRGTLQARSKELATWSLADLGLDPATVGATAARSHVLSAEPASPRADATTVGGTLDEAVAQVVGFLAARGFI